MLLSDFHYEILQTLKENNYCKGDLLANASGDENHFIESLHHLFDLGLVSCCPDSTFESYMNNKGFWNDIKCPFNPIYYFFLTESGSAQLDYFKREEKHLNLLERQINTANSIALSAQSQAATAIKELDLAKERLRLAEQEAKSANKDSLFSKFASILAIIISIISIIVQIIFR